MRGWSRGYYIGAAVFGVLSSFYIVKPILNELENRKLQKERETAINTIEEAAKLDQEPTQL